MEVCKEVQEWVEENIEQEIEKQEQRCKSWPWPFNWVCSAVTFVVKVIVTIGKWITRVVCEVVTVFVSIAAMLGNFILAIPLVGPFLRMAFRAGMWAASLFVGFFDGLLRAAGARTTKKLRIYIVPLSVNGVALATEDQLVPIAENTRRIFRERLDVDAQIKIENSIADVPDFALDIGWAGGAFWNGAGAVWKEYSLAGSWYQIQTLKYLENAFANLIGIANPIIVYVVREIGNDGTFADPSKAGFQGVSLGPLADWVAVEAPAVIAPTPHSPNIGYDSLIIAHEIGHALGYLSHDEDAGNLMFRGEKTGDYLTPFQVGLMRSSPKITYI
jgi:hypothetical protein